MFNLLDEFKNFFAKYGKVEDHQIIRDHATNRSRGFGFIIFESEQVVDDLIAQGNMIDMDGTQVSFNVKYAQDTIRDTNFGLSHLLLLKCSSKFTLWHKQQMVVYLLLQ